MSMKETNRVQRFIARLHVINKDVIKLPGLAADEHYDCLARQLVDSRRRIEFIHAIRDGKVDAKRADPTSEIFDPLRAAVFNLRKGNIDEACWLVFLAVHFGKHGKDGWALTRAVYGRLGGPGRWDWKTIISDPKAFQKWLLKNQTSFQKYRFSNHRKYESLRANSPKGTAAVLESYISWVSPPRTHAEMIKQIHLQVGQNPRDVFNYLYKSMDQVLRFGRLGRFDFLAMLGKLGIAPIEPGSAFLWHNATGPKMGARLLFGGSTSAAITAKQLDRDFLKIDEVLDVGMQTLEDAICNWQKAPNHYMYFKG